MLNKRTQILFDKQLWNTLVDLAREKNTSVGGLVRSAVRKQYIEDIDNLENTVEEIRKFRDTYGKKLEKGQDSASIIRKMREERYGQKHLRRLSSY
ncbi:hypothetical protein HYT74_02615 [Candidatus Daviesbacteria bacterium]|nr:hypothetical protein [Candidatus Daviesbacteria bacterium]